MPPEYNPFKKYGESQYKTERELRNYQERYRSQGLPLEDDPSFRERVINALKTTAGYGLKGLDILYRPFNAAFTGARELLYPEKSESQGVLDALGRGIKGEEYTSLGDIAEDTLKGWRIPIADYPGAMLTMGKDILGIEKASPEFRQQLNRWMEGDYGKPEEPGFWNTIKHMGRNATFGDLVGFMAETKVIDSTIPKLAPAFRTTQKAKPDTLAKFRIGVLPVGEQRLRDIYRTIQPELENLGRYGSLDDFTPTNRIPFTEEVREFEPQIFPAENRFGGIFRDDVGKLAGRDVSDYVVQPELRKPIIDLYKKRNYDIADYGVMDDGSQYITTIGIEPAIQKRLRGIGANVTRTDQGNVVISVPSGNMWDDVLSAIPKADDMMPTEWVSPRIKNFQKEFGDLLGPTTAKLRSAVPLSRTSPGGQYRIKGSGQTGDLYEAAKEIASSRGIDLEDAIRLGSEPATWDDLKNVAQKGHMSRVVGLGRIPQTINRTPGVKFGPSVEKVGRQLQIGNRVIAGPEAVGKVTNPFKKYLAEDMPGVSNLVQLLGPMLSRRFVSKGTPDSIRKIADILDQSSAIQRANITDMVRRVSPALRNLSDNDMRVLTYARDVDKNFDFSNPQAVTQLVQQAELPPQLAQDILVNPQKYQDAMHAVGSVFDEFADIETGAKVLDEIQENYVPHMYESDPKFRDLYKAKDVAARRFAKKHKFTSRKGPQTLIEAKQINRAARAEGLPEPHLIKEDRINRLLGARAEAHYRTMANVDALNKIKGIDGDIINKKYQPGFVRPEIPQLEGYWVHPELNRILVEATGRFAATGPAFQKFLVALQKATVPWKTLVTRVVPTFHIRNEMDNMLKLYLDKTDMSRVGTAANILRGANGELKTPGGTFSYDEIRRLIEEKGITGTGIYGYFGDIPEEMSKVAMETAEGPIKHFLRYINPVEVGRQIGNTLETHSKLTKFVDELSKHGDPDFAAQQAQRLMFNYADLTPVERDVLRTVYPFWTFHRKNIPLMYELLIEHPEQFLKLQTAKNLLEQKFPLDDDGEPEYVPDYMKEMFNVRLPGEGSRPGTRQYFTPGFSIESLQAPYQPGKMALENLNPMFKIPLELAMDHNTFFGDTITDHGEATEEIPTYFDILPEAIKKELGIHWATNPDTGDPMLMAPAEFSYLLDSLSGSAIREIGNIFETQSPGDDPRNMIERAFIKEIDPEQAKYFKMRDEIDRMRARTSRMRNEGVEVKTLQELGKKRANPFKRTYIPE